MYAFKKLWVIVRSRSRRQPIRRAFKRLHGKMSRLWWKHRDKLTGLWGPNLILISWSLLASPGWASMSHTRCHKGCKLQQISRDFYPTLSKLSRHHRALNFIEGRWLLWKSWLNWSFFGLSSPRLLVWNCPKSCHVGSVALCRVSGS